MSGLQKQAIAINLGLGIDSKTDEHQLPPGKLLELENCVFKRNVRLDKKDGDQKFSSEVIDGSTLVSGDGLATFRDELLQYQNQTLYSYSESSGKWIDKGSVVSAIVKTEQIVKNTATQTQCDSAAVGGISVYAWEDSRGGIRASVFDDTTKTPILVDSLMSASGTRARCIAFNNYLYIFYYNTGNLRARRINPLAPSTVETAITVSSTVNTSNPNYDIYPYQDLRILFAHNVQGSSAIKLGFTDDALNVLSGSLGTKTIAEAATNCLGIVPGPASTFFICYQNGTNGVRATVRNNSGSSVVAPFTIENITASNVVNVTGHVISDTSVRVYYEVTASSAYNQVVRFNDLTVAGSAGTPADFLRSVGLYTKAFLFTDSSDGDNYFVGLVHSSSLQGTYFVARSDRLIIARSQATLAGGLTTRPVLVNVWTLADGIYNWANINKTQLVSQSGTIFTPTGVARTSLDFTSEDTFTAAELGGNLHIVGGSLSMYDGQSVVEHGFHLYPENFTVTASDTGGALSAGTYQVVLVYEWSDNLGQIHRSVASVPKTGKISNAVTTGSIVVVADTLRLTAKTSTFLGTRTDVSIVGYVSDANGSILYRFTSVTTPILNDITADTVALGTITAVSTSNELLYTTGGVLDNSPAPPSSVISVFKNRIFLGNLETANTFWFSKENKVGEPVSFSDTFQKALEPEGGSQTSFGVLDDKILIFKSDRYFFSFGDGPSDTGEGDFAEPQFVTSDVGCSSASSVVRAPVGLMVKTAKGIYLIDSTLNPTYAGSDVEAYNDKTITSGVLVPDQNQVRFTTLEGPTLIYDYYQKQWGTFSNILAKDALIWNDQYIFLRTSGAVYYETPDYFKDAGSPVRMKIGTGWFSLASVVGFQRIYRMFILGEYKSPHMLKVSIGYDYSPAYSQVAYLNPDDALDTNVYGEFTPYGEAGTTFGGDNNAYRFQINLKQQKCQAIRFLIEELTTADTTGDQDAFSITSIGLLAGIKQGFAKLRAAQKITTGT